MTLHLEPSPEARRIYGMMVARADNYDGELVLSLAQSIKLSCTLSRTGRDPQAVVAVAELKEADWITPEPRGGWCLG
jgi:hypothetical protein